MKRLWGLGLLACAAAAAQTAAAPAWDYSGRVLAFVADGGLYVVVDGVATALVASNGVTEVSLARDGTRAVFTAAGEVRIVDFTTGEERTAAPGERGAAAPHLSPDGVQVLYAVLGDHPLRVASNRRTTLPVYTGELAPAAQRAIDAAGRVVFTSSAPFGPTFAAAATDVWLTDLAGGQIRPVTRFGNHPEIRARDATISEEGGIIAFVSNAGGTEQVWLGTADGGEPAPFTFGPEAAASPSLSADGRALAWIQSGLVWVARTDCPSSSVPLTAAEPPLARQVVLSGDGSRVAFTAGGALYTAPTGLTID